MVETVEGSVLRDYSEISCDWDSIRLNGEVISNKTYRNMRTMCTICRLDFFCKGRRCSFRGRVSGAKKLYMQPLKETTKTILLHKCFLLLGIDQETQNFTLS